MVNGKYIAIVDDSPEILSVVSDFLEGRGFSVKSFSKGEDLFVSMDKEAPDLIILDVAMPGMSGFEICKKLKEDDGKRSIPVIMLSAKVDEPNKVFGLDIGADDYVEKPFSEEELNSRINAVLRRSRRESGGEKIDVCAGVVMDPEKHELTVEDRKIDLTVTEFKILELLSSKKGHVFTRARLLDYLWGDEKIVVDRTIDVHVRHLREKLGEKAARSITNVRGVGYKLEE